MIYLPKSKADKKRSLLGKSEDSSEGQAASEVDDSLDNLKDEGPVEWVSYWKPNITINLVDDFTRYVSCCCSTFCLIHHKLLCGILTSNHCSGGNNLRQVINMSFCKEKRPLNETRNIEYFFGLCSCMTLLS